MCYAAHAYIDAGCGTGACLNRKETRPMQWPPGGLAPLVDAGCQGIAAFGNKNPLGTFEPQHIF